VCSVNQNAPVLVIESESIGRVSALDKFRFQCYQSFVREFPAVELRDLSSSRCVVSDYNGLHFKNGLYLPALFWKEGFLISLAKVKTHTITGISGALKNMFGCLPDPDKAKYHPYLSSVIADVNRCLRPDLGILDACPALEGAGPVHGEPRELDLLMLSADLVALDATMARMMGFNPGGIDTVLKASGAGIGVWRSEQILIDSVTGALPTYDFRFISRDHRFYVAFGLLLQRIGLGMGDFGHRVHCIQGTSWLIRRLAQRVWEGQ
jgi:uncharacterized protein (DUF362 family)